MIGKKINQLATELAPVSTDLTIIGNPTTGVSKKITLAQLGAIFSGAVSFYTNLAAFPTPGTTDVIYCAKDTQKLYLWSGSAYVEVFPSQALLNTYQLRSEKGVSNGYASLDSTGKVPISQLPSSIMEYKGTWNAATNTPTLANGTGDTGDVYICNVAGTVNFGAGPITFAVGDYVIYSGSIWQRSSGAVGTVTSVAASITGNSIGITGSPVTTSGTLAFAFAGTGTQYIKGDGTLATFPSTIAQAERLITEVYNSTGATLTKGTIVYINGGQGNLPTVTKALATGDSTSAQTFGVVQADITNMNNGYVVVAGKLSDLDTQAYTEGTQLYLSATTAGTWTSTKQYAPAHLVYVGIVVRSHPTQGIVEVKIQNGYELDEIHNVAAQTPTNNDGLFWEASTSLWKNKSISTILGGTPVIGSGTTNFVSKFTASSTIGSSQIWDNGTSVLIGTTGTLPGVKVGIYSSTQRALEIVSTNSNALFVQSPAAYILTITNGTWTSQFTNTGRLDLAGDLLLNTIANATIDTDKFLVSDSGVIKYRTGAELLSDIGGASASGYVPYTGATTNLNLGSNNLTAAAITGSSARITTLAGSVYADVNGNLGTTAGTQNTIAYWGSQYSLASLSTTTYPDLTELSYVKGVTSSIQTQLNSKQSTLTNPVTGTGTTNYLPKFTGTSTIGNSQIFDNGTNVGIGATALYAKFQVSTNASGVTDAMIIENLYAAGADVGSQLLFTGVGSGTQSIVRSAWSGATNANSYMSFWTKGNSSVSEKMRLDASGNLGLGVTPNAWRNLFTALQVGYTGSLYSTTVSTAGEQVNLASNYYQDSAGNELRIQAGFATRYQQASGQHRWSTAASSTAGSGISFTQAMTLDANGRLGIGTTSPTALLDVRGTGLSTDFRLSRTIDPNIYLSINAPGNTPNASTFGINGTNVMTLNVSGNVGIGTTSPSEKLDVNGKIRATDDIIMAQANPRIDFDGGSTGALRFLSTSTGNIRMVIQSGGNVGIGTTSPSSNLSVRNEGTSGISIIDVRGGVSGAGVVQISGNGTTLGSTSFDLIQNSAGALVLQRDNNPMLFYTNNTERMRITSGGNVGIGTTSPNELLSLNATGNVNIHLTNATSGTTTNDGFKVGFNTSLNAYLLNKEAGSILFYTSDTLRATLDASGNLGIGTTSPTSKLHVVGLPTSSAGLTSGAIWNDGGTLKIV